MSEMLNLRYPFLLKDLRYERSCLLKTSGRMWGSALGVGSRT